MKLMADSNEINCSPGLETLNGLPSFGLGEGESFWGT